MITCRVCQSPINVEGKMHQHVVKCGVCNEATVSCTCAKAGFVSGILFPTLDPVQDLFLKPLSVPGSSPAISSNAGHQRKCSPALAFTPLLDPEV